MPMYNLIEYSDNYLKTSGHLWQYYRDEPFVNDSPDSASFKYKQKITSQARSNGTNNGTIKIF